MLAGSFLSDHPALKSRWGTPKSRWGTLNLDGGTLNLNGGMLTLASPNNLSTDTARKVFLRG